MATFAERFGGAAQNVDYSRDAIATGGPLPVPLPDDSLEVIRDKIGALAKVVTSQKSVAVATGFTTAAHDTRDPEVLARMSMTPMEEEQLDAWRTGLKLPSVNWDTDSDDPPDGDKARKRMERRAAALAQIYKHPGVSAGNAVWFTKNHEYMLPLVISVAKIHGAERELVGGQTTLNEMELAEVQAIHKINAVALNVVNDTFRQLNILVRAINTSKDTLQAREHAIKDKLPKRHQKESVANKYREAVGKPKIGAEFDYRGLAKGGRAERSNLLAGTNLAASSAPTRPVQPPVAEEDTMEY